MRKIPNVHNKGFTLIELLVVISIISLISTAVFSSLAANRAKARNIRRIADLTQIRNALELYFSENGQYPQPSQGWTNWSGHCDNYGNANTYILNLAPKHIAALPRDPSFDSGSQCYLYNSTGQEYMILAHMTMELIVGGDPSAPGNPQYIRVLDRVSTTQPTIGLHSPGAAGW